MKKLIYTIAILLSELSARANHMHSELLLDVHGNTLFTVMLDNQFYGRPDYHFSILDVLPGTHYLQVQTRGVRPFTNTILFSGYINLSPASRVMARIDRFGRYKVLSVVPICAPPVVNNVLPNPHQLPAPYLMPMSNHDFDMLRNSINSKSFESTKMEVAKQVLSERYVSAQQVMELMNLMTFESSKLDLAKYAFNRTIDKRNYFQVNDSFTFESSIHELDEFIRYNG